MSPIVRLCDGCRAQIPVNEPLCGNCLCDALDWEAGSFSYSVVVGGEYATLVVQLNPESNLLLELDFETVADLAFRLGQAEEKLAGVDRA